MKKLIVIALAVVVVGIGVLVFGSMFKRQHTVSDFSVYPCEFKKADRIVIAQSGGETELSRISGEWRLTRPVQEVVDMDAGVALNNFMFSKLFVDRHETVTDESWQAFANAVPTQVSFYLNGEALCGFELGSGEKTGDVDSERRWVRSGNDAYRAYVHLLDFGRVLEQPTAGWRDRRWLQFSTSSIESVGITSIGEQFEADRTGAKSADNPQGWRVTSAKDASLEAVDVSSFEIDPRRIATVVDLLTPLMVDDWADDLSDDEHINYNGSLQVRSSGTLYKIEIGDEVDYARHPRLSRIGPGARYVRVSGDSRVGVISRQRVMGLFPSLDEMRSRKVWSIDTKRLAAIDVESSEACVRYQPASSAHWAAVGCPGRPEEPARPIPADALGTYAKVLMSLEAVRYVSPSEREQASAELSPGQYRISLYMDDLSAVDHEIVLSRSFDKMYRYARVVSRGADGSEVSGPAFVISEGIATLLLSDLGHAE